MVDRKEIIKELNKVIDPEIGAAITDMDLVDEIKIDNGNVELGVKHTFERFEYFFLKSGGCVNLLFGGCHGLIISIWIRINCVLFLSVELSALPNCQ